MYFVVNIGKLIYLIVIITITLVISSNSNRLDTVKSFTCLFFFAENILRQSSTELTIIFNK